MQSVSSRIWTRVAVSNSYDDNDYTTGFLWYLYVRYGQYGRFAYRSEYVYFTYSYLDMLHVFMSWYPGRIVDLNGNVTHITIKMDILRYYL